MTTPEGSTPMNKPVAPSSADVTARLAAIVGERYVLTTDQDMAPHLVEWRDRKSVV